MHYCPISDFWILCALQVNRVVFRNFLELQRRRRENPRRDVATSRRLVNSSKSQRVAQRCDVATFPRFLHHSYIKHGRPNFWSLSRDVQTRAENEARATQEIEKTCVFVFLFSKLLMIYKTMLVLNSEMF